MPREGEREGEADLVYGLRRFLPTFFVATTFHIASKKESITQCHRRLRRRRRGAGEERNKGRGGGGGGGAAEEEEELIHLTQPRTMSVRVADLTVNTLIKRNGCESCEAVNSILEVVREPQKHCIKLVTKARDVWMTPPRLRYQPNLTYFTRQTYS